MIKTTHLSHYPNPLSLDDELDNAFLNVLDVANWPISYKSSIIAVLKLFKIFLDVSNKKLCFLDLNQSQEALIRLFVGFVYVEIQSPPAGRFQYLVNFRFFLAATYKTYEMKPPIFPSFSRKVVSKDVELCKLEYRKIIKCPEKLKYYEGWFVFSKNGEAIFFNLSQFELQYGEDYSNKILNALNRTTITKHFVTARTYKTTLIVLLELVMKVCPTLDDLKTATDINNINCFFEQLFSLRKLQVKTNNKSMANFYKSEWKSVVKVTKSILIGRGIWPVPPYDLFCPKFSAISTSDRKKIDKHGQENVFNNKLITKVPLYLTDAEAIEAIIFSVERDVAHVSNACRIEVDRVMGALRRRNKLAAIGTVKKNYPHGGLASTNAIDMSNIANQAATWEFHTWNYRGKNPRLFFGFSPARHKSIDDLGLLGSVCYLVPFALLLIEQHPSITESWLLNLQLFDSHDNAKGFRQSGNSWVLESVKRRRGSNLGQQIVILNEVSRSLVENLILYTNEARDWLRKQGSDDWRYLFLSSATGFSKPIKVERIYTTASPPMCKSSLVETLLKPVGNVGEEEAKGIVASLGCSSMRASCGVQVYLRTKSVKAMSEALGHDTYNPRLLSSYLPAPILDFFQSRWVSIFQHALIFEAMKDSEFLFDAINISKEELELFLANHALKPFPEHMVRGQINDLINTDVDKKLNDGVITVSVSLLKVLNALVEIIDRAPQKQKFSAIAIEWYEAAKYIHRSIQGGLVDQAIVDAMNAANSEPLDFSRIRDAIYA